MFADFPFAAASGDATVSSNNNYSILKYDIRVCDGRASAKGQHGGVPKSKISASPV